MRLKRVRIFGFKTFADRTEFNLDGDLIAIVGPNGCGKSNIVDAILWALGESNSRNIRAQTNQDVIFNGSSKRKPVSYAEVTLILDNEDGALPLPLSEIEVTRRLSRSGESTFSVNKRACRLKDIHDLFADSGLGRSGYSIVGQREIDNALSASAEERRAWIDEAAGVQRFRAKRHESLKRLEDAEGHLKRVTGIIEDLQTQRLPLESEAVIARQYLTIKEELAHLEIDLLKQEVRTCVDDVLNLDKRIAASYARRSDEEKLLGQSEMEADDVGGSIAELERKLDAVRELRQSFSSQAERSEAALQLTREKIRSLAQLEENLSGEQVESGQHRDQLSEDLERATAEVKVAQGQAERLEAELGALVESHVALNKELSVVEAELDRARKQELEHLKDDAHRKQAESRLAQLVKEKQGIDATMPALTDAVTQAIAEHEEAEAVLATVLSRRQELLQNLNEVQKRSEVIHQQGLETERTAEQLTARIRGIESTLEMHEGLAHGAQAVLNLVAQGALEGKYTPVVEAIEVDGEFALAIETALGGALNDLIVEHDSLAKRAIQLLKERNLGRATFQPLNLVKPSRGCVKPYGVLGVATQFLRCHDAVRPVLESLLGRVLLAENLDQALAVARSGSRDWSKIVTLDGEVIFSAGAVTGGKSSRQNSGILHRKAELAEAQERLEVLNAQREQSEQERVKCMGTQAGLNEALTELDTAEAESNAKNRKNWLDDLSREKAQTLRELEKLAKEEHQLRVIIDAPPIELIETATLNKKRDTLRADLAKAIATNDQAKLRLAESQIQRTAAKFRQDEAKKRYENILYHAETREKRLANMERDRAQCYTQVEAENLKLAEAKSKAELHGIELQRLSEEKAQLLNASFRIAEAQKESRKTIAAILDTIHRAELERARADSRRAIAVQRLQEEYGLSVVEGEEIQPIPEDATAQVAKLKREIRSLGTVNLGAIEAFERLTERFEVLSIQLEDILESKQEIEKGIHALEQVTSERFLETFGVVSEHFKRFFAMLFGGGEAEISLSEAASVLQSGVQIDVTIPGKKRQKLELLSGGERSLCACAFLFALLKTKPSPLVVLDEVDAPLDGRNVERYIQGLQEFAGQSQFMLITHNPVTIEAAPLWFGVTMREPGVTTLLPFNAPEKPQLISGVVSDSFLVPQTS